MSNLIPFQFESQEIRTINADGEVWIVAKDVAEALGYAWAGSATISHVPNKWKGVNSVQTPRGPQEMSVLSEQGLYFFLGRSDKPKALPFQMWIAGEVLPQIRQTGSYGKAHGQPIALVESEFAAACSLAQRFGIAGNQALISANQAVRKVHGMDCMALLGTTHLKAPVQETLITPTEIAQRLGRNRNTINPLLEGLGLQVARRDHKNRLYWELTDEGMRYAEYLDTAKRHTDGTPVRQVKWYPSVLDLIQPKAA